MSKILTVFGATGSQGGSVIKSIREHPVLSRTYKIRGVTRLLQSAESRRLAAEGVDMVQADLNEVESVYRAILGSHAVFAMTNFWEYRSAEVEFAQGKAIADGCKKAEVEYLIWSTLSHATTVSGGKLRSVHHFDSKADVESYIRSIHIPASFVNPGCFMSNLKTMLTKTDNGSYKFALPMPSTTEIPLIDAANDTGKWVASILSRPSEALGRHFLEATGWYTIDDICTTFTKVTGKEILFQQVSESAFEASSGKELCEAWILLRDYAYFGLDAKVRLQVSLQFLGQQPTSLEQYLVDSSPW